MLAQLHCEEDVDHNAGTPIPTILEEAEEVVNGQEEAEKRRCSVHRSDRT